jgi:hypothetical protein
MVMLHLTVRVHRIRVLSKEKSKLKRKIVKQENIIKSMLWHRLSAYEIRVKTKIDTPTDTTLI